MWDEVEADDLSGQGTCREYIRPNAQIHFYAICRPEAIATHDDQADTGDRVPYFPAPSNPIEIFVNHFTENTYNQNRNLVAKKACYRGLFAVTFPLVRSIISDRTSCPLPRRAVDKKFYKPTTCRHHWVTRC